MAGDVASHYGSARGLAGRITESLRAAGKDMDKLGAADLASVDEFHIRGRKATLELGARMNLRTSSSVLDIGSGLGGPARTLADEYGCQVTGVDLTAEFCEVANLLSGWVNLGGRTEFLQGNATDLPFEQDRFDAAMTIHVAMNIPDKDKIYEEAQRVLTPGGIFAVCDVLKGEGGDPLFPVPWARDPSISHLATPEEMSAMLADAGFKVLDTEDSTVESQSWFEALLAQGSPAGALPSVSQIIFGGDVSDMVRNQVVNLRDRRIRTVSYICEA